MQVNRKINILCALRIILNIDAVRPDKQPRKTRMVIAYFMNLDGLALGYHVNFFDCFFPCCDFSKVCHLFGFLVDPGFLLKQMWICFLFVKTGDSAFVIKQVR